MSDTSAAWFGIDMLVWPRPDILQQYSSQIDYETICTLRSERQAGLHTSHWEKVREPLTRLVLPKIPVAVQSDTDCITVGQPGALSPGDASALQDAIKALIPWRKGPYEFFGEHIDAEWRSDKKWDRIARVLSDLTNKLVIDIGCNNGYYMFRMLEANPRLVYGIDPSERTYYQFELVQRFLQNPALAYDMFGIEHLPLFPGFFDVALCMGILYHHRNPYHMLLDLRDCLRPGGLAIVESIVIPGEESTAICVPDRYAMMRNVYFISTVPGLVTWLDRSGFVDIEVLDVSKVTIEEQRQTAYAPYQSLADFLDPDDPEKTVEGFPAPYRACIKVKKRE